MTCTKSIRAVVVVIVLAMAPGVARASILLDLFNGGSLTVGDKLFSNWMLWDLQTTNGATADVAQISVQGLADDPLNPGLLYDAPVGILGTPFGHSGPSSAHLRFYFSVETLDGSALIKDNTLWLRDFIFDSGPDAIIRIGETIVPVSGPALGTKSVFAIPSDFPGSGDPDHFDSAEFAPQSIIWVETVIDIIGPGDNDGAYLTQFEQRFSQVPEPSTLTLWSLIGMAGVGFGWWRKRRN